jgi:hypothetical protein
VLRKAKAELEAEAARQRAEAAKALALQKAETAGFRATTARWRSMEPTR